MSSAAWWSSSCSASSARRPSSGGTSPRPAPVTVRVGSGERFADVAHRLVTLGLVRHTLPLVLWARVSGKDRAVHFGEYQITTALSPRALLARLTGPSDPLESITIPEGREDRKSTRLNSSHTVIS